MTADAVTHSQKGILRDYFETIVVCVIFVIFSRAFVFQQSKIPSGSMQDTLLIGDYIMVNRFVYSPAPSALERTLLPVRDPERHDVIVFKYPEHPETDYIKRIIGLPGDQVEVRNGQVLVNDQPQAEPFVRADYYQNQERSNWGPTVVPSDNYFVMGDHRNNSQDSRYWGFVPRSLIKGRAYLIWYSYEESEGDWQKTGMEWFKGTASKFAHFFTRSRWSRCFSLIR